MVCANQVAGCETSSSTHPPPVRDWATFAKWRVCMHEVGHLLAGAVLLKRPTQAMIFGDGSDGGLAYLGNQSWSLSDNEAIAVAAGAIADHMLAGKYSPPEGGIEVQSYPSAQTQHYMEVERSQAAERVKAARAEDTLLTDEVLIARWCIAGYEHRPYRWKFRHRWLEKQAFEFVKEHEQKIVALAEMLFELGSIALPAQSAERA